MENRPSYEECLEIVRRFKAGGYDSESENQAMMDRLTSVYRKASDLIFWDNRDLSPEEILKEAEERGRPILL